MSGLKTKCAGAIAVAAIAATPVLAEKANQLTSINGSMGRDAEYQLQQRGFSHVSTNKNSRGYAYSYWWDEGDDDCVQVEVYNGRVESISDASDQDCGHHRGSDAAAAVGVVAGAALLGALFGHKSSHHEDGQHHEDREAEHEYERGYNDGLHNASYHNYSRSDAYSSGYSAGVDEREANLSNHQRRGGYDPNCPSGLRGNECEYYMDGYRAGASDGRMGMSMAYQRHDGYDSRFEPYFARGYEDGWRQNR